MKSASIVAVVLLSIVLAAALEPAAFAGDAFTLNYGGRLAETDGRPVSGPLDLKVNFYRAEGDTVPIAAAPQVFRSVNLKDGVFQLSLAFAPDDYQIIFPSTDSVWIEVEDLTTNDVYARQKLGMVPFAGKVPVDGKTVNFNAKGALAVGPSSAPAAGQFLTKDASGAFIWASPQSSSLGGSLVSSSAPGAGQVLKFNGTQWGPTADSSINRSGDSGLGSLALANQSTLGFGSYTAAQETALATTLGNADKGKVWFNGSTNQLRYWDGATAVTVGTTTAWNAPGAIGATTPASAAFTTVTTSGAIGINKSAPGSQLDIKGTGATAATSSLNVTDSTGNSNLFVRDDGRIGIGTTAPNALLSVAHGAITTPEYAGFVSITDGPVTPLVISQKSPGAFWTANSGVHTLMSLRSNSWFGMNQAVGGSIDFSADGYPNAQARLVFFNEIAGTSAGALQLQTHSGTAWNNGLSIDGYGNTYLGTKRFGAGLYTDPQLSRLLVQGSTSDATTAAFSVMNSTPSKLLTVLNDGHVGIGTTNPSVPLHVAGDALITGTLALGQSSLAQSSQFGGDGRDIVVRNEYQGRFIVTNFKGGYSSALVVDGGNVGIGTATPQTALDINGAMRLLKNASAPFSCIAAKDGSLALTSQYTMCVCNGGTGAWVQTANGSTGCSW